MILGDFYIFLSVFDDLLGQVVVKTGQEMKGNNEPTPRFTRFLELTHRALNQLLLKLMQFLGAVKRISLEAQLLTH